MQEPEPSGRAAAVEKTASAPSRLPKGKHPKDVAALLTKLEAYLTPEQVGQIYAAYEFGADVHEGQRRLSGEPFISHPVAVASLLADLHLDAPTITAAILHDVIEDTPTAKEQLAEQFGQEVAALVDGVSKLDRLQFRSRAEAQAESFRKMLLAMADDIRVIMVKLADRTHNMRTLASVPPAKRRRIARETLEIYAPIANRLGINSMRLELEELGFKSLYPYRHRVLERALRRARGNQRQFLRKLQDRLEKALRSTGIEAEVQGREKHLYSIYRKMQQKGRSLNEIVDVFGLRIIVDDADTCYRVLGAVHSVYRPMPGRFKDYIAIPRINGYQSLHTTLFGPNGLPIEVQIRTEDMDRIAEAGIAAHWRYKSGDKLGAAPQARAHEWLKSLIDMQGNSEEFLESVKIDLFPDKVYVFTPTGEIRRLPRGATVLDFAYAVHTDVGNRCVAAKVDRRLVPLRTQLATGQTVEILTARGANPNPAWINFVVTAKARAAIRNYLKNLQRGEASELGRRLLDQALGEFSMTVRKVGRRRLRALTEELSLAGADELFEKIGLGERLAPFVARRLVAERDGAEPGGQVEPLGIAGTEGMVVTYARCCYPIPDDPIMGYLSAGRGVVIHRNDCGNLAEYRKQPEKWVAVEWAHKVARRFSVEIRVEVINRLGVLAEVAANIAESNTNIEHVAVVERDGDTSTLIFQVQVKDRTHLEELLSRIRSLPDAYRATRSCA
ncbi:bifunctional (p)ppGpp synthetase/guanosine-3',5'-bis(diphosphate) 3'-pyrophosphohydrolase [soil metagenome]